MDLVNLAAFGVIACVMTALALGFVAIDSRSDPEVRERFERDRMRVQHAFSHGLTVDEIAADTAMGVRRVRKLLVG
ncbi:hypothetical protein [Herbiconiux daphne]|uniref:Helix-turn-helix domain-containing protein n=1 Tax=Herbiconiux daphne TaxID=2970914 RepID=A0ABT2GXK0_9MICO|nr:hypothetical protein [Herbiconiux daphne]MCS5732684.1 hypothetical protein [Herbiconiux daphne]